MHKTTDFNGIKVKQRVAIALIPSFKDYISDIDLNEVYSYCRYKQYKDHELLFVEELQQWLPNYYFNRFFICLN